MATNTSLLAIHRNADGNIFVSIVSYRDSECWKTVIDLYARADTPSRIYVGIVWQYVPHEDVDIVLAPSDLPYSSQIYQLFMHAKDARGPLYARAKCMSMLPIHKNIEYYLQIDSHMRFIDKWDTKLIQILLACSTIDSVISAYPPGYSNSPSATVEERNWQQTGAVIMRASNFGEDGFLRIRGRPLASSMAPTNDAKIFPPKALFVAAGFLFTTLRVIKLCEPTLDFPNLFFGEETLLSARLFTHGIDCYLPPSAICAHLWSRSYRPSFREATQSKELLKLQTDSEIRVKAILSGEADENDKYRMLGRQRTLAEWYEFTGVNFKTKTIEERSLNGNKETKDLGNAARAKLDAILQLMKKVGV